MSPVVERFRLGQALRAARENRGVTAEAAAKELQWSPSKVSRLERGLYLTPVREVEHYIGWLDLPPDRAALFLDIAADAHVKAWWDDPGWGLDPDTALVTGLEHGAMAITCWAPAAVPVVLQDAEYARGLIAGRARIDPQPPSRQSAYAEAAARRAAHALAHATIAAVIEEAVLYRSPATAAPVLVEQLGELVLAAHRPDVTIQVLPTAAPRPVMPGPFTILQFAARDGLALADMLVTETLTATVTTLSDRDVWLHRLAYGHLADAALSPEKSLDLLAKVGTAAIPATDVPLR
jgi:transcriptional regulator with XRE-family HTH domain